MSTAAPPMAELHAPPGWRAVDCLSDLHLEPGKPATLERLLAHLHATSADAVFLLGDLFEVWVGDDALDEPGSFEADCAERLRAAAALRPTYCMHGNRDFLLGEGFARRTGIALLADPTVLQLGDRRWLLTHGDALCLDDVDYQRFRAQARDPAWQARLLARPLAERRATGRAAREHSESRKQGGTAVYADVDAQAVQDWLHAARADALVHGHTHLPGDHRLPSGAMRHVLTDWDLGATPPRAGVLRLHAGGGCERLAPAG
ncbi:UDP-2,3-diacylglucosamine hydrolase [Oryzisolibacter propanilivorax]|uniref:UDP-2,3-diacylglucosamine hydrolase n=1 Tax=Oryzisolibacter propanilivorax TaxID=1527607 RepID=A0A1G9SYJ1_9BURK|nr:UDP-2,3-diacylglucosamine diphosphatase [Oryzisolibacter propanilivorax]SDM40528.1 UDP-2,3-diacylglucosamine hydrolase [Oryzisolibacter propanilivorax]